MMGDCWQEQANENQSLFESVGVSRMENQAYFFQNESCEKEIHSYAPIQLQHK